MMRFILFMIVLVFAVPAQAQERFLTMDLASDHVDITTGFNGTMLQLFGVSHQKGDIAIIVRGPMRTMSVRRKESVLGAWINRSFETYKSVPSYYNYALSAPIEKLAPPAILKQFGVGTDNLQFNDMDPANERREMFRRAMIRNKESQGLYVKDPGSILFVGPDFFRADFYVPSNVPVGQYEVQAIFFQDGAVIDTQTKTVRVAQVGGPAQVYEFAHNNSLMYGLLCVMLAIFAGWFSNRVRRG